MVNQTNIQLVVEVVAVQIGTAIKDQSEPARQLGPLVKAMMARSLPKIGTAVVAVAVPGARD